MQYLIRFMLDQTSTQPTHARVAAIDNEEINPLRAKNLLSFVFCARKHRL